jgi:ABC-type polar amino acid transport system ATPase subunit
MTQQSESVKWRKEGNRVFQNYNCFSGSLDVLKEVLFCYQKAVDVAKSSEERASASKNCAKICWKQLQHLEPTSHRLVIGQYKNVIKYFNEAINQGIQAQMSTNWLDEIR